MKQTIYTIAILFVAVLSMTSCTHNNGDIGPYFGLWHVETIECDGIRTDYEGTHFFAFQSTVFQLRYTDDVQTEAYTVGTWTETDAGIDVRFPDEQLWWTSLTGIAWDQVNHFTVESLSGKNMVLSLVNADGHTYRYTLKKWG